VLLPLVANAHTTELQGETWMPARGDEKRYRASLDDGFGTIGQNSAFLLDMMAELDEISGEIWNG
jgi:hypothetical protein